LDKINSRLIALFKDKNKLFIFDGVNLGRSLDLSPFTIQIIQYNNQDFLLSSARGIGANLLG
jgi:hypothetical protein